MGYLTYLFFPNLCKYASTNADSDTFFFLGPLSFSSLEESEGIPVCPPAVDGIFEPPALDGTLAPPVPEVDCAGLGVSAGLLSYLFSFKF